MSQIILQGNDIGGGEFEQMRRMAKTFEKREEVCAEMGLAFGVSCVTRFSPKQCKEQTRDQVFAEKGEVMIALNIWLV